MPPSSSSSSSLTCSQQLTPAPPAATATYARTLRRPFSKASRRRRHSRSQLPSSAATNYLRRPHSLVGPCAASTRARSPSRPMFQWPSCSPPLPRASVAGHRCGSAGGMRKKKTGAFWSKKIINSSKGQG